MQTYCKLWLWNDKGTIIISSWIPDVRFILFLVLRKELLSSTIPCWRTPRYATFCHVIWKSRYCVKSFKSTSLFFISLTQLHEIQGCGGVYTGNLHPSAFLIILFYSHSIYWRFRDPQASCRPSSQCPLCQTGSEKISQYASFDIRICSLEQQKKKCFNKFQENPH